MATNKLKPPALLLAVLFIGIPSICKADDKTPKIGTSHPTVSTHKLVWQDEFSGKKLDRSKWAPEDDSVIGQYGHGNGESQVYLDAEGDTFYVKDGKLTIVATHAPAKKYPLRDGPKGKFLRNIDHLPFKSAKLKTEGLASFTYGLIEARIKNPTDSTGKHTAIPIWPAFWMLPESATAPYAGYWDQAASRKKLKWAYSAWPYSGEIDIMEMSGRATRLYHAGAVYHKKPINWTVGHLGWHSHYRHIDGAIDPKQWIADQVLDGSLQPKAGEDSYPKDYHIYGCKWTKDKIAFMLDHKQWGPSLDLTDKTKFGGRDIYKNYPFYLILNQAIGGNYFGVWGPANKGPDKKGSNELYDFSLFPQYMNIDWVRVYRQEEKQSKTAKDLVTPEMTTDKPAAGKRVRQVAPEYKGTQVYHALYLPVDWKPDGKYSVIVEYTGNKFLKCGSTGEVKGANLGYGLTGGKGFIWVSMPYIQKGGKENAVTWWGDRQATVDYCKTNLPKICKQFGGNLDSVFICGFSRGAIGASYIGLADDEIAALWKGMFTHDHFDGDRKWGYPMSDRKSALVRLARLKGRPVLVCGEANDFLRDHLKLAQFTFLKPPVAKLFKIPEGKVIHPHTDRWMHRESTYRKQARQWLNEHK